MNSRSLLLLRAATLACAGLTIASLSAADTPPGQTSPTGQSSPEDLRTLLRDALFEEEATRDLAKAAVGYEALLTKWGEQRQFAAAALFRLAEVRRKQDRKDDAVKLYQRLLAEFPDIDPHARLSRENLAALGAKDPATPAAASVPVDPDEEKELRRLMMLAENSPDKVLEPVPWPESGEKDGKIGALANAATRGWAKVATFLLDHGADPNVNRSLGGPPLYAAAANGHKAIVELLLAKGANINTGSAALGNAIADNYTSVAELLIAKGVDINDDCTVYLDEANKKGSLSLTPLAIAISRDNKTWIDRLLELKADVNAVSTGQHMPTLHVATWRGNRIVLQKLLDLGAKPDAPDALHDFTAADLRNPPTDGDGWRALHYAAGDPGMTEALLKAGADPSAADSHGLTPLHVACMRGQMDCVRLLLAAKSDVNARGTIRRSPNSQPEHSDITPLHAAALTANTPLIEALLAAGANPNPPVPAGQTTKTPLALALNAVFMDNKKGSGAIAALLNAKADPNGTPDSVPVIFAAGIRDAALRNTVLSMLLDAGADPDPAIRHAHSSVRIPLLRNYRYPQLAEKPEVTLVLPDFDFSLAASLAVRTREEEKPDSLPALLLAWHKAGGRMATGDAPDWSALHLWRKATDGKMAETVLPLKAGMDFPALQWGDVIEFVSKEWDKPVESRGAPVPSVQQRYMVPGQTPQVTIALPPDIYYILHGGLSARVTFKTGDFSKDLTLRGLLRTYDPATAEAPFLSIDTLVSLIAGDRAGKVKIEHTAAGGGGIIEWEARSGQGGAFPEDGDIITFTPDPSHDHRLVALRIPDHPGRWTNTGSDQNPTLLQFLADFYGPLPLYQVLPDGPKPDTTRAAALKALTAGDLIANLIRSGGPVSTRVSLPWPDWSSIKIRRMIKVTVVVGHDPTYHLGEPETVDLAAIMAALPADATPEDARELDIPLSPGDEVEISRLKDHPAGPWHGFDETAVRLFQKALAAKVTLVEDNGRFREVTLQWLPPRWVPTPAGVLPIPDGDATGGRVHWPRARDLAESVIPGTKVGKLVRDGESHQERAPHVVSEYFLRPGDTLHLYRANQSPSVIGPANFPGVPQPGGSRTRVSPSVPQPAVPTPRPSQVIPQPAVPKASPVVPDQPVPKAQ